MGLFWQPSEPTLVLDIVSVTASETLGTFKRRLKTHLFATSFP